MNLTWAPDSSRFAFTKDNDLYVCAKASSDTLRLTHDGSDLILNGYASTSWLTMLEVVVVSLIISGLFRAFKYNDSKKNIIILAIAAGVTKIFTSYGTSIVEALMAGTAIKTALVASFFSLPATVINSCSTAICTPILYFFVKTIFASVQKQGR